MRHTLCGQRHPRHARDHGGHAVIVDFHNAAAAAVALDSLLTDDARHARLRAAGIEWTTRYTFEKLAAERIQAIRTALAHA